MALLPDLDDIPFLNPYYDTIFTHMGEEIEDGFIGEGSLPDYESINEDGSGVSDDDGSGSETEPKEDVPKRDPMMEGWFPGKEIAEIERSEFERLDCRRHFLQAKPGRTDPMPKGCERLLYSISFLTFQVSISLSVECSPYY